MKAKINSPTHKKRVVASSVILGILLIVLGWRAFVNSRSYPLGDRLQYLGKQEVGGGLFIYATRFTQYYYGTDMTAEEVVGYFKGAKIDHPEELHDIEERGGAPSFRLTHRENGGSFVITYYNVAQHTYRIIPSHINWSSKKHVILITSSEYETAKDSLN